MTASTTPAPKLNWIFDLEHHPASIAGYLRPVHSSNFFDPEELEGPEENPTNRFAFRTLLADHIPDGDAEQATAVGDDATNLFLGAIKIFDEIATSLKVVRILFNDGPHYRRDYEPTMNLAQNIFAKHFALAPDLSESLLPSPVDYVYYKALQDSNDATLLRYFAEELTWVNMYRITEMIKKQAGSWYKPYEATNRLLGGMANVFAVTGTEARHAEVGWKPPASQISKADAQLFCQGIAFDYLTQVRYPVWKSVSRPRNAGRLNMSFTPDDLFPKKAD